MQRIIQSQTLSAEMADRKDKIMLNRYLSTVHVVLGVVAVGALLCGPALGQATMEKPLYERLGGYGAISAVVNDFAEKLFIDPQVGPFFKGMGTDTRKSFIQKNINLVCAVTGGPCKVISRDAKTVHAGLGITEAEFNIVVNHLVDTLDAFKVPAKEKQELLSIIGTLKPDIVEPS
jgi:hemoglobin